MVTIQDLKKISKYEWEVPVSYDKNMLVPVRLITNEDLLEHSLEDSSIEQAINTACLPGVTGAVVVMPDMHQGYGFPIGGVAAMKFPDGVISPGGIGYDINCGVRLLSSSIQFEDAIHLLKDLSVSLYQSCPSGVGVKGNIVLNERELKRVCESGSGWALRNGYADKQDLVRTEENGCIDGADFLNVSQKARLRGLSQLGTLGSGNHFIEVDVVDEIYDEKAAQAFGLVKGNLSVMIHCGSRGFGHQICTDYVQSFQQTIQKHKIHIFDRELVCAPLSSKEGKSYLAAMRCAANYAFCNRQILAYYAREAFERVFGGKIENWHLSQVYDVAHNIGKIENHMINGQEIKVCVHRKGATRSFGPGSVDLPPEYQKIGQPVLVPGSMGTSSWVLAGTALSMEKTFGSCCHGAGRVMSRKKAKKNYRGDSLIKELKSQGVHVQTGSLSGLSEEAPGAYKNVEEVISVVIGAGIASRVAKLRPVVVIKG